MTPDYLNRYDTIAYKDFLVELITQTKTKSALEILYRTMPTTSPGFARVVNFYNQFGEAEIRKHDGLAGWQEEMSRINLAVIHMLDALCKEYPDTIPLRQPPLLVHLNDQIDYDSYEDYEEEDPVYQPASSSGIGIGIVIGVLLVGIGVFMLAKSSGKATAGPDSPQPVYGAPQIGWVLMLDEGENCETLAKRYDFVFRHHGDAEVVETKRGVCSLLIRFPDKKAAEARKRRSTSLKRTFPGSQVVNL